MWRRRGGRGGVLERGGCGGNIVEQLVGVLLLLAQPFGLARVLHL